MPSTPHGNLRYAMAVLTLAASAGFMQLAQGRGWLSIIKKPLPIRKPLQDMDRGVFFPPFKFKISGRLSSDIEAELGTTEYINWILEVPDGDTPWSGQAAVAITYYTDKQDQVPHVPEECFYQSGMTQASSKTVEMEMTGLGRVIDVQRVAFLSRQDPGKKVYAYYVLCVNHDFYSGRSGARWRMKDNKDTHLFYSKIEVSLGGATDDRLPELDAYARELLDRAITELVRSHWPLKGWERGGPPPESDRPGAPDRAGGTS